MQKSEQINDLAASLARAQAKMKNPAFDSTNPFFKSRYASLAAVRNAVVPVLAECGIAVVQEITHHEGHSACSTTLLHASGQWLTQEAFSVNVSKDDAQGACAAATYTRRVSLQALACVVGDEDDDAEAIVDHKAAQAPAKARAAAPNTKPPAQQLTDALLLIDAAQDKTGLMRVYQEVTIGKPAEFVEACKAKASHRKVEIQAKFDAPLPGEAVGSRP